MLLAAYLAGAHFERSILPNATPVGTGIDPIGNTEHREMAQTYVRYVLMSPAIPSGYSLMTVSDIEAKLHRAG